MASPHRPSVTEPVHWVAMTQRSVPPPPIPDMPHHDSQLQMQPYTAASMRMEPSYGAPYHMMPRHFALQAHHSGQPFIELNERLADMATIHSNDVLQLNRRANEQEDEIDDMKQIFKNDLQALERRLNSFMEHQKQQSSAEASQNPPSPDPFVKEKPVTTQDLGRIVCETKDAIVDVLVQHIDEVRAKHERIDSAYGSPVRTPESSSPSWRPMAIRKLPTKSISKSATHHNELFSWDFLRDLLGGKEWSPGYYFNCSKDCILPTRGYWMVNLQHEPFMPHTPGEHGAKLTAFFNETLSGDGHVPDEVNYKDTPVFVSADGGKMYRYVGKYSQKRYSDKVGYDTMMEHIPQSVLKFHADQLAQVGRPAWVTECLRNHFWPKPTYQGEIPSGPSYSDAKDNTAEENSKAELERGLLSALKSYANELKEWEQSSSLKVNLLKASSILEAFNREDVLPELSLRLWWEYLECVGYEDDFYDMLVNLSKASSARHHPSKSTKPADTSSSHIFSPTHKPPLPKSPLYGSSAKALQKKQWLEDPGVDASSLPETKWSAPTFDDPPASPSKPSASAANGEKPPTGKSTNPFSRKGDLDAAKAFAKEATTAQPRTDSVYARKAAAATASKAAVSNNTYPTYPPTPAFGETPSKSTAAEPAASQSDVKKTKAIPPHLNRAK